MRGGSERKKRGEGREFVSEFASREVFLLVVVV